MSWATMPPAHVGRRSYVTMDDVAREAGVSRALVSLVMREQPEGQPEAPRPRPRRRREARLPAQRDRAEPREPPHQTVGVLLNDLHNPFFAEIANGIEEHASSLGYRLLIITGGRRQQRERAMLEALLEYRTDGLILVSPRLRGSEIARRRHGCRASSIGRRCAAAIDCVMTDEPSGRAPGGRAPRRARPRAHRARRRRPGRGRRAAPRGLPARDGATAGLARCADGVRRRLHRAGGHARRRAAAAPVDPADRGVRGQRPRRGRR